MNNILLTISAHPSRLTALFMLTLFTVSCAQAPAKPDKEQHVTTTHSDVLTQETDNSDPFIFARDFLQLTAEAQRAEVMRLDKATHDLETKLMLALAYGLPSSAVKDTTKAQTLLDEIINEGDGAMDEASLTLATIVRDYVRELSKSSSRLREEQKRVEAIQSKLDELQKKLDDLKNIEKTMVDRDQGVRK